MRPCETPLTEVIFEVPQRLKRVKLVQAAADHPQAKTAF